MACRLRASGGSCSLSDSFLFGDFPAESIWYEIQSSTSRWTTVHAASALCWPGTPCRTQGAGLPRLICDDRENETEPHVKKGEAGEICVVSGVGGVAPKGVGFGQANGAFDVWNLRWIPCLDNPGRIMILGQGYWLHTQMRDSLISLTLTELTLNKFDGHHRRW